MVIQNNVPATISATNNGTTFFIAGNVDKFPGQFVLNVMGLRSVTMDTYTNNNILQQAAPSMPAPLSDEVKSPEKLSSAYKINRTSTDELFTLCKIVITSRLQWTTNTHLCSGYNLYAKTEEWDDSYDEYVKNLIMDCLENMGYEINREDKTWVVNENISDAESTIHPDMAEEMVLSINRAGDDQAGLEISGSEPRNIFVKSLDGIETWVVDLTGGSSSGVLDLLG